MGARLSIAAARKLGVAVPASHKGKASPRKPRPTVAPTVTLSLTLPVKLTGSLNSREHWAARHRRVKAERDAVLGWLVVLVGKPPASLASGPLAVTLMRLGGRVMDDDNLAGCCKAARDALALDWLGCDDGDGRLTWAYRQRPGGETGVQIEISARGACSA